MGPDKLHINQLSDEVNDGVLGTMLGEILL